MYKPSGPSNSARPTLPTLALTKRNAPIGMIHSTHPTARSNASFNPFSTRAAELPASPLSASATPRTMAKMIIPSGCPSAIDAKGFAGINCRAICSHAAPSPCSPAAVACINLGAASNRSMPLVVSAATSSGASPNPGPTNVTSVAPNVAATNMVAKKYALVLSPNLPSREGSPSEVIPATTLVKINGSTSIISGRTKIRSPATENPDTVAVAPARCSSSPTIIPPISAPIDPVATQRSLPPNVPAISERPALQAIVRNRGPLGNPCQRR